MKVQELQVSDKFDVITSRAFADLSDFVNWSGHLLAEGGRFIALKGVAPQDEQERLPAEWKVSGIAAAAGAQAGSGAPPGIHRAMQRKSYKPYKQFISDILYKSYKRFR